MANPTVGFGLRLAGRYDGAAQAFQMEQCRIAYDNSHTFGTGNLVIGLNTGYIDAYTAGGAQVKGVFAGCSYFSSVVGRTIWSPLWNAPSLASTVIVTAWILSDPAYLFEIRTSVAPITIADIGANVDVVVGTTNAITGQSTTVTDGTTMDSTSTFPLRIHSIGTNPTIDNTLVGNIGLVSLNTSVYRTNTGV